MPKKSGPSKKETLQWEIARAVGAGKEVSMESVDFSDPDRPKTCLEVDFPILPVNQVAIIEGNAGKPIYQMSKWWARRRSSVFRSMLIAAATKAPDDPSHAAKLVWDNYYANHQKLGAFKHLKVADVFMGGGTTLVEGSRLGMQMFGNDLNPVAWFVVKQELAKVDVEEVKRLLADIEAEVKPQIMPYYCCDGPKGEKGKWTHKPTGRAEGPDFDPLSIPRDERKDYSYEGPEIIYTFWAKHGPCQVTGCGHRTPIMSSPVMAIKTLTVKCWDYSCTQCGKKFDLEDSGARMAPDVPLYVVPGEKPYATLQSNNRVKCPHCKSESTINPAYLGKGANKKIELSLLVHPQWLAGGSGADKEGRPYGGSAQDDAESTVRWNAVRAKSIRLLEVRGALPDEVEDPDTGLRFAPEKGTVQKRSHFTCASCGKTQDLLESLRLYGKAAPMAGYGIQGFTPKLENDGAYNGRFFAPFLEDAAKQYDAAIHEWETRKETDLSAYWPRSAIPIGAEIGPHDVEGHHFSHWWTMFNPRQMLVHALLLKAIANIEGYSWESREYVLGAFQQYLRNQNMFCFWNPQRDTPEPHYSRNSFHPKATVVENCVFPKLGRGNWTSSSDGILEGADWCSSPWDTLSIEALERINPDLAGQSSAKGEKVSIGDPVAPGIITQGSSTELSAIKSESFDLVITDPPFGDLVQYSELSDFFYVWLRLVLKDKYPEIFGPEYTPKTLEAVANRFREPADPNGFYQRLLTQCWREAHRILKPAGLLAFTFHHSEDAPWVAVLESLFNAGYYLEATYPIRSDETKGEGQFGSQKVEYDIIHVCRKRTEEPTPVSWGRMRREVLSDVNNLQAMLENHAKAGLPTADLQVIRRGKALEYYSRHYGKVYVDLNRPIDVREALVGINQLIDEDSNKSKDPPPANAEPTTRQFLRIFDGVPEVARDQMQKFLKGSGIAPDEFVERGWCEEKDKVFHLIQPLAYAQLWKGEKRSKLITDLDQALFLVGACVEGSGINAGDTLRNGNFKPHVALKDLLEYLSRHLSDASARNAASRAHTILKTWVDSNRPQKGQMGLFGEAEA
jgi:putative DNA methylase